MAAIDLYHNLYNVTIFYVIWIDIKTMEINIPNFEKFHDQYFDFFTDNS